MEKYNWLKEKSLAEILKKDKKFWEILSKKAYPKTHGKIRIPISLEPFFIEKKEYDDFYKLLYFFMAAAKKIADKYFFDERIRKIITINEEEKYLIEHSSQEDFIGVVRPDLFWAKSPKLVELNSDFPDGFFMHDITAITILENINNNDFNSVDHAELFSQLLDEYNFKKSDHIFIGYDKNRFFIDEFYLTKLRLEELGWNNISVGAFEDLSYSGNKFYYNDKKIDLIRRGAELFKIRSIPGLIEKLVKSQKEKQVKVINNFKNRILGHKSLLAALWDESFHKYLNSDEINSIKSLLPMTLKLNKDNFHWVIKNKDRLVIKPSDLAEGEGVSVGINLNKNDWIKIIKSALKNCQYWIVQEKIDIPEEEFSLINQDKKIILKEVKKYDFNPYLVMFKDKIRIGKVLVRFSDSNILNVLKGGGLTYSFVKNN